MAVLDRGFVAVAESNAADGVGALPNTLIWVPAFWIVSFVFWRFGLWVYGKTDPTPTLHAGTVWGARILASCSLIFVVDFGWRAWYVVVPTAMALSGLVYTFIAKAWAEQSYLEDVRDTLAERVAFNESATSRQERTKGHEQDNRDRDCEP